MRMTSYLALAAALLPAAVPAAAGTLHFTAGSAEIRTADPEGHLIWRVTARGSVTERLRTQPDGSTVTGAGHLLDPFGGVVARQHADGRAVSPGSRLSDDCPYWDELAEITPPPSGFSDAHAPLLVDSMGNVWVIDTRIASGKYKLLVRQSIGHTGEWGDLEIVADSTKYVSQPQGAIDGDDNVTIVYRDISSGYHLYAIRYEPGSGWGELTQFYSTSTFFQAIEVAADADGDVVTLFDPSPGSIPQVWSVYRDADTGEWTSPDQISAPGYNTLLPTLTQNRDGTGLYAVYLNRGGGPVGLYGHRWDAAANAWGPAEYLPGSETAGFSFAGPVSRFPMTVGDDGEATVPWQAVVEVMPDVYEFTVYANRTAGGSWQPAHELLPPGPDDTDIENFAYADSSGGDAMVVLTRYESGSNRVWAFRYSDATGWQEAENPFTSTLPLSTRIRCIFYQGARAMASFYGPQHGINQLTSLRYTGTGWLPDLVDIPGEYIAYYQDPIADGGEALLVFEAEKSGNQGIKASWLRNKTGDIDCDGVTDVTDMLALLGAWGPCPGPPPDCPEDLNGDGSVDVLDLLMLLAAWD